MYIVIGILGTIFKLILNQTDILDDIKALVINIILFYILCDKVHGITVDIKSIYVFYKIIVYFIFVASLYNMVIHSSSLIRITSLTMYNTENICSFFDNKNTFGVFLLFGVVAATILRISLQEKRWFLFALVFIVNEMMAMCRTAIVLSVILILISAFYGREGIIKKTIITLLLVGSVVLLIYRFDMLHEYVFNNLFGNTDSLDTRNSYITDMLPLIKGIHAIFGYGTDNARLLAIEYAGNQYFHNTYLKVMISGGAVKLGLQFFAMGISVIYCIRCWKNDKVVGELCFLSFIIYVLYSNVESVVLFDSPVVAIMSTMFIITMPILFYNSLRYGGVNRND